MRIALARGLAALALAFVPAAAAAAPAAAPPVTGVVQDTAGVPLPNARVMVTGLGRTVSTDHQGRFTFRGLPAGSHHLSASLIGYAPAHAEVTVPADGDEVRVTITLRTSALQLTGIQVTATPSGADPLRVAQSTTELSGTALARYVGTSVAGTLSSQPGLASRYGGPAASTPVIRGLSGERVLVLQDGQRSGDLSSTSADHALSVDPLAAQRIEVVRGPASLLYGNNALGGVVNVISGDIPTSVPSHAEGYFAGQGESVNPGGAFSGAITLPVGESFAVAARGGVRRSEDVRVGGGGELFNSWSRSAYGVGGFGFAGEAGAAGIVYRHYGFEYGLPTLATDEEAGAHIEGTRREVSARGDLQLGARIVRNVRLDGTAQWYEHDEVEPEGEVGTSFGLRTQTLSATARTGFGGAEGAVGVSGLLKQYEATGEEALTPAADSRSGGIFAYQEVHLGRADGGRHVPTLQLGARFDTYRIESKEGDARFGAPLTRDFDNVSGSVGISLPVGSDVTAGFSVARAFRAPTVEELFSNGFHAANGTFDVGDPTLRAETNQGFDAVLRAQTREVTAQVSGYVNRISDFIFPDERGTTTTDDGDIVPLNVFTQADATLRGLEGQVEAQVSRRFVVGAMGDVVRGRFSGGAPLPYMPAARVGGSLRWDDGRFSVGTEVRHAFRQAETPAYELRVDEYTLVNLSAGLRLNRGPRIHTLTLRADNLLDEAYREATSRIKTFAPNPGRNLAVVYKVFF